MPSLIVKAQYDLGNMREFDAAVRNSALSNAQAIERVNTRVASQGIGRVSGPLGPDSGPGLYKTNVETILDAYDRTFIQRSDRIRRVITGYTTALNKEANRQVVVPVTEDIYTSSISKRVGDQERYAKALLGTADAERQILAAKEQTAGKLAAIANTRQDFETSKGQLASEIVQQRASLLGTTVAGAQRRLDAVTSSTAAFFEKVPTSVAALQTRLSAMQPEIIAKYGAGFTAGGAQRYRNPEGSVISARAAQELFAPGLGQAISTGAGAPELAPIIRTRTRELDRVNKGFKPAIDTLNSNVSQLDQSLLALKAEEEAVISQAATIEKSIRHQNAPQFAEVLRAGRAPSPIPKDLAAVLNQSPDLRKGLLSSGLGLGEKYGTAEFQKAISTQEASVSNLQKNLRTGLTNIQGSFRDASGKLNTFTADLDNQNKVVGRWGGQLAGSGQFLNQTVRNLQKVIQWTVATTVVFGALALAAKDLKVINALNADLTRLSITAQLSSGETTKLFGSLAKVAYDTATPLEALIKVSDDVALATRVAGQSSDEWKAKIISLTTAVGIFTNLTGADIGKSANAAGEATAKAADELSAAFKQLNIQPDQLVGILSKVTAVAGGQSGAIADVVKSLGSVSEAAKAAGLNTDEIIASVQTLAQVTNKSSDDIATSFKNLFGSISSRASTKALKEFGIEVRDAKGELRPFLVIYHEIADAISKGIIPQGRVQDVLRGISGGPRRAPDAAAVLGNLPLIDQAIQKSANATNEALVANAKVLDTNAAKLTQFQNTVDLVLFQKFGQVVVDLTANLTGFATAALNLFGKFDTGILASIVQFGGLIILTRSLASVLKLLFPFSGLTGFISAFTGGITRINTGLKQTALDALVLNKYARGENPSVPGQLNYVSGGVGVSEKIARAAAEKELTLRNGLTAIIANNKLKAGAIAGVAALGVGALASGSDSQGLAVTLQTLGGLVAFIPGLQALGVATFGVGTALQFLSKGADTAKISAKQLSSEIYTNIQQLKDVEGTAKSYATAQQESGDILDTLRKKNSLTKEEQALLTATTDKYVTATLSLASANQIASDSFSALLLKLPNLSTDFNNLKSAFDGATLAGSGTSDLIEKLRLQVQGDILQGQNLGIYAGAKILTESTFKAPSSAGGTTVTKLGPFDLSNLGYDPTSTSRGTTATTASGQAFDLTGLISDPTAIKRLFSNQGAEGGFTTLYPNIPINPQSLALIQGAVEAVTAMGDKAGITKGELDKITETFLRLSVASSTVARETAIVAQNKADIIFKQATGTYTGEQADNALAGNKILGQIATTQTTAKLPGVPTLGGGEGRFYEQQGKTFTAAQQNLSTIFNQINDLTNAGKAIPVDLIAKAAEATFGLTNTTSTLGTVYGDLKSKGENAFNVGIYKWAITAGVSTKTLIELAQKYHVTLKDIAVDSVEVTTAFEAAAEAAQKSFAQQSLQIVTSGETPERKQQLTAQKNAALQASKDITDVVKNIDPNYRSALVDTLSKLPGLEDIDTTSKGIENLGLTISEMGKNAHLSGTQIDTLNSDVKALADSITKSEILRATVGGLQTTVTAQGTGDTRSEAVKSGVDIRKALALATLDLVSADSQTQKLGEKITKDWVDSLSKGALDISKVADLYQVAISDAAKNFSDRSLQLAISKGSGDYRKTPGRFEALSAQNIEGLQAENELSAKLASIKTTNYSTVATALSKLTGLEKLNALSATEFASVEKSLGVTLIENAVHAGVNAAGIKLIRDEVILLIDAINNIKPYKEIVIGLREVRIVGSTGKSISDGLRGGIADGNTVNYLQGVARTQALKTPLDKLQQDYNKLTSSGGLNILPNSGGGAAPPKPGLLDIPKDLIDLPNFKALLSGAVKTARGLQHLIPGEDKANAKNIVELLNGTKRVLETRGVGEEFLRRALDELSNNIKKQNDLLSKADTIRRIRVGSGDFAAFANVPLNSKTGVSVGGPQGPISINIALNGQLVTPAQFEALANSIGAALKKQIAGSGG